VISAAAQKVGPTLAWTKFKKHPIQQALWRCRKRFVAVPAGRGSGKTELAKRKLVLSLYNAQIDPDDRTNHLYFYGGPTAQQAKRVAWTDLQRLIPKKWLLPGAQGISHTDMTIRTHWGAELWVVGLDKPQRIEGKQFDGCVLDESCDLKPKVFDRTVLPTLAWYKGWCWRIGVPKRQGPAAPEFRAFYEDAVAGKNEDAAGFTWPSSDILPPEMLAYAKATLDARDYAEQFDAQFQTAGGGIFYCFDERLNIRQCMYDPKEPLIIGSDFNMNPMAWVIGQTRQGIMEWFDELWLNDLGTADTLSLLWSKYHDHKAGFHFYGDAAARQRKTSATKTDYAIIANDERFKKAGRIIRYPRANPPVPERFASSNAMLRNADGLRRMFIDPRCEYLINDLRTRYYKPGTNEPDTKIREIGHISDAMGYAVHALFPIRIKFDYTPGEISIITGA
jgi:hypothetical protein